MTVSGNAHLHEQVKIVECVAPSAAPAADEIPISMRGAERVCIVIQADNATTVTGSAITLKQSTVIALTDEKALAFTKMFANVDTAAGDTLTETTVAANTFTTAAVDNKNMMYVIEVKATDLDIANNFDVLRVDFTDPTAQVISATYFLYPAKYGAADPKPSAIID